MLLLCHTLQSLRKVNIVNMKLSRCCGADYLLFITVIIIGSSSAYNWNYSHQDFWFGPCLTGRKQSPINLEYSSVIHKDFYPFKLTGYDNLFVPPISEHGHIIKLPSVEEGFIRPKLSGGGLEGGYILDYIHLHWKSEHTINGKRYAVEAHLMHYAEKYENFQDASRYPLGVAVLATLFQMCSEGDPYIHKLIEMNKNTIPVADLGIVRDVAYITPITAAMFLPRDRSTYFRYEGSLTTPTCNEGVVWTVFTQTLQVSEHQTTYLPVMWRARRAVLSNNRDIQRLYHRKVYFRNGRRVIKDETTSSVLNLQAFNGYFVTLVALGVTKLTG